MTAIDPTATTQPIVENYTSIHDESTLGAAIDLDGSGDIDESEFVTAMEEIGLSEELAKEIFELLVENDDDGIIEIGEYSIEEINALAFSLTEVDGVDAGEQTDGKQ